MKCKHFAGYDGICTNGDCFYRAELCPVKEHQETCIHFRAVKTEVQPEKKQISDTELLQEQALDKQEPMKVLNIDVMINLVHTNEWTYCGICPNCNEDVYIEDHKIFCGNCGQALDWSDVND